MEAAVSVEVAAEEALLPQPARAAVKVSAASAAADFFKIFFMVVSLCHFSMFLCFVSAVQRTRTGKTKARGLLQAPRHTANDVVQLHFKHRQSTSKTNVPGHTDMPGSKTFDNTCGRRRWHGWYTWHISPFVFVRASCSDSLAVSYTNLPTMSIC